QVNAGHAFYQYEMSRWWIYRLLREAGFEPFHAEPVFISGESLWNPTMIGIGRRLRKFASRAPKPGSASQAHSDSGHRAPASRPVVQRAPNGGRSRTQDIVEQSLLWFAGRADVVVARPV